MNRRNTCLTIAALAASFVWAYSATLRDLAIIWEREPDYSHGFLVIPFALGFLWLRRADLKQVEIQPNAWALSLIIVSLLVRWVGHRYAFDSLDGYSMILWLAGATWLIAGRQFLLWALPAIGFLIFMVPLPFQVERLLSVPLQRVATEVSCFVLQCLGQPAFAEGTTILLGNQELHVERACSGLRIFLGTIALAFAYLIASRRELWEQTILLFSVIPIALVANALRIVVTGLLYRFVGNDEAIQRFCHDSAGWFMILVAATLFAMTQIFLTRLIRRVEVMRMDDLLSRSRAEA